MAIRIRPTLNTLAAALMLGAPAFAEEPAEQHTIIQSVECSACEAEEEEGDECSWLNNTLFGECFSKRTGLFARGWLNGGITVNDGASTLNGPLSFNDRQDPLLNQLYLIFGRAVDADAGKIDVGFQVDLLYGSDAQFSQALGFDENIISTADTNSGIYEMAIPQLYAELFIPVGNGLTIKAGHFYTIIGYEVVTAPDNFFYSHAFTMQYAEPFTHTGVLASYDINDLISVSSGFTRGWDNWEDNNNALSYLGGVTLNLGENTSLAFAITTGPEQDEPRADFQGIPRLGALAPGQSLNRTMYSIVFNTTIFENLNYILQHDNGWDEDSAGSGTGSEWYGLNQYLIYKINDKLSAGARFEWFRDDDGSRVAGVRNGSLGTNPGAANFYGFTVGLNYFPVSCITIRPELRWDYQDRDGDSELAYDNATSDSQFTAAVDFILRF